MKWLGPLKPLPPTSAVTVVTSPSVVTSVTVRDDVDADELRVAPAADGVGAGELAAPVVDDAVRR